LEETIDKNELSYNVKISELETNMKEKERHPSLSSFRDEGSVSARFNEKVSPKVNENPMKIKGFDKMFN
jgi:hypothetical protein